MDKDLLSQLASRIPPFGDLSRMDAAKNFLSEVFSKVPSVTEEVNAFALGVRKPGYKTLFFSQLEEEFQNGGLDLFLTPLTDNAYLIRSMKTAEELMAQALKEHVMYKPCDEPHAAWLDFTGEPTPDSRPLGEMTDLELCIFPIILGPNLYRKKNEEAKAPTAGDADDRRPCSS